MPTTRLVGFIGSIALLTAACGGGARGVASSDQAPGRGALSGTVTVLAAASLTDAFEEIGDGFEAANPGVKVATSFDGSSALAAAIAGGAPADVFASADQASMARLSAAGLLAEAATTFTANRLQIVVAAGNPLDLRGLADLRGDVVVSLCAPEVPCGAYAAQAFERAGLAPPATGEAEDVKGVLSRVQLGEADAGLVYVTDVLAAEGVEGVDLAPGQQVEADYPAAVLADAPNPRAAAAFLAFLSDGEAQAILRDYGFVPPSR